MREHNQRKLDAEALYDYAIRLLGGRSLSTGEVRERLSRRAADAADVEPAIRKLKEYGFLDDARFAGNFAAARRDNQGFGPFRVARDLRKRRVAPALAGKAATEAFAEVDEAAQARRYLERKYRGQNLARLLGDEKNLAAAYRRLRVAGFASGVAIRVLQEFAKNAAELESLENDEPSESLSPGW